MSKDILDEFHRLVAVGEYRDARGILESEPEIDPQIAEKWLRWLDDLHADEWLQVGVVHDLKKRDPIQSQATLIRHIGGTSGAVIGSIVLWLIVVQVFTFANATTAGGGFFLLVGVIAGFLGWQYGAQFISRRHRLFIGAGIAFGLWLYIISSGIPMWYYNDPPLSYLIAAFLLLAPAVAFLLYKLGAWLGFTIWKVLYPEFPI